MGKKGNKISYKTEEEKEITKFIIVIVVVTIFVVGAYFLTRAFVSKDLVNKNETKEEEVVEGNINYNVAIVGEILNRPKNKYYVVVYNMDKGDYKVDMNNIVNTYRGKDKHLQLYEVDLANKFNESFYDPDHVYLEGNDVSKFRFGDVTLLRVEKGKVVKAITDLEKIKKELGV